MPHYDFNWQLRYDLAEPMFMPKGSRLICTAHFDNSADNPLNPDPTQDRPLRRAVVGRDAGGLLHDGARAECRKNGQREMRVVGDDCAPGVPVVGLARPKSCG